MDSSRTASMLADIGCARLVAFGIDWKLSAPLCEYNMKLLVFTNNNQINIRAMCRYVSDVEIIKILTIDDSVEWGIQHPYDGYRNCSMR